MFSCILAHKISPQYMFIALSIRGTFLQMICRHSVISVTGRYLLQYLRKLCHDILITDILWQGVLREMNFDSDQYLQGHSAWIAKKAQTKKNALKYGTFGLGRSVAYIALNGFFLWFAHWISGIRGRVSCYHYWPISTWSFGHGCAKILHVVLCLV